jgi:predicted TPR repeat methyltransferase
LQPQASDARSRETLNRAIAAHQKGDLATAERLYRQVLGLSLAQPDALHYLGVLQHQRGHSDEAVELIRTALAAVPEYPDAWNNLGNVHKECGRLAEAEGCYRKALACAPTHDNARINLAIVLEAQDRLQEALVVYQQVLERAPHNAHAHWIFGLFLFQHPTALAQVEEAVVQFRRAVELGANHLTVLRDLGVALYALGRRDEACDVYREWLAREPDNPVPRHMLAASGGAAAPARADDAYVRDTFDGFAASFDEQLVHHLDYRAPKVLADALQEVLPTAAATLDVLDAGCGTGLCGPFLRPHARRLTGVDLSGGMLARARQRGGYDELAEAELTAYFAEHADAWDVIVSADTLVYFGDLRPVIAAAYSALRAGGWFAFSLEATGGDGFELSASGRYRHGRAYVERALREAGFTAIDIRADSLRKEAGQPVASFVVLAQRGMAGRSS